MPFFKLNNIFAGRYQLSDLIEEGDFAEVWKAKDQLADNTYVVLKIFVSQGKPADEGIRQFSREFSLSQNIHHPHLLKPNHFDVSDGYAYLLMPCCFRGSLKKRLEKERPFSEWELALLMSRIGSALEALHRHDPPILHQDVRPENILFDQADHFFLALFGISPGEQEPRKKAPGDSSSASIAYAPPESFDPSQEIDSSADIFSFGVTLYEMCTKTIPWNGTGGKNLLNGGRAPKLPEQYSRELSELLQACMSPDRRKRPGAGELRKRSEHFLKTGHWRPSEKRNETPATKKRLLPYFLVAATIALLLLGAFWVYMSNDQSFSAPAKQDVAASYDQDQEIDAMLIATLEEELENMKKHAQELEAENRRLRGGQPGNSLLLNKQERLAERDSGESDESEEQEAAQVSDTGFSPEALEKQLNRISNPQLPAKERSAWKKETMARFAEGDVRIVDESEGGVKQYSTSIFLNLLSKVPHQIVVKEVKTDQNRKVTELRLTMEAKM